ncbi:DNA replication/repair protein RecF [Methylophaga sp. OBS1]|uniref:DNA replication/repair protein RecF n=1 Tax=Methylophaga sp. OBS1 TaxID=2991933 RepID=UPI00225B96F8|nr:DNA replication/repair protein RecF [Methylophaga sp. OBS1]MCX4192416.1 DNA replication/repair protein RecF [Methylophaga sp. OBS1]
MLAQIQIHHFRNIVTAELFPSHGINFILGENGSGKTSLLEAIFVLAMGRSFRSRFLKNLVNHQHSRLTLFARSIDKTPIGLQYDLQSGLQIRLNNASLKRLSDLAFHLPVQLIPANCHQFFEQGPKYRRRMVDWGVFHVEHHFNYHWQSYKKVLQQRNAAIKSHKPISEIKLWDKALTEHGLVITEMRERYLKQLIVRFRPFFSKLCPELAEYKFSLRYLRGWNKEFSLADYLEQNIERDQALGYTRSGPHAADWSFKVNDSDPYEMLSRGQQKLFFLSLSMAQIMILADTTQRENTLLLIDDLSSELDWHHQQTVVKTLRELPVQSFISSTNRDLETLISDENDKKFHVEHGMIYEKVSDAINTGSDVVE